MIRRTDSGARRYSVGEAMAWAWAGFAKNARPLIVATVAIGLIGVAGATLLGAFLNAVSPATFTAVQSGADVVESATRTIDGAGLAALGLAGLVVSAVGGVVAAAWYRGLLSIADGEAVSIGSFLRPSNTLSAVVASVLIGVVSATAGLIVTALVPSIGGVLSAVVLALWALVTFFALVAIVDDSLSPVDGIRAGLQTLTAHPGPGTLAWIVTTAVLCAGTLVCAGILVAAPVAYLIKVFTWRRLTGGRVVPITA